MAISRSWRRVILGAVALIGVAGVGITAYQWIAGARLRAGFENWVRTAEAEGWQVSQGGVRLAGWPSQARLEMPDFRISAPAGGPEWRSARLLIVLPLLHPDHVTVRAEGRQSIGQSGGVPLPFDAKLLKMKVPFQPGPAGPMAEITADAVAAPGEGMRLGSARLEVLATQPELRFVLETEGVDLPPGEWPLGQHVAMIDADGAISGGFPVPGPAAAVARAWREKGGQLQLNHGSIRWGPLDARIEATGGLDGGLQPVATGTAWLTGYAQALDLMVARHLMTNDAALAAKAVLSLLARSPAGGGGPEVEAPFTVRDNVLSVGPIPLMRLRPIAWAGG